MTDIACSDLFDLGPENRAELLPWNYLSAGFDLILDRRQGKTRILMILPTAGQPARFAAISAETLKDPFATSSFIADLDVPETLSSSRLFIGPATVLPPNDGINAPRVPIDVTSAPWNALPPRFDRALVIIDAGIAFWNHRFRDQQGPRFRGMRYLDFDLVATNLITKGLDEGEIASLCDLADAEGSPAVIKALGADFPNSVFGRTANPDPDGFWHGTAVADLAAGAVPGEAGTVAMFGLELPRAVVADYSGEMLTGFLAFILEAAINLTSAFSTLPLTIVMPLGFPAGLQDGSHPAVQAILSSLSAAAGRDVKIVVPAGNQLQDRCRARLDTSGSRGTVFWDLPPDDFSTNEVELFGRAAAPLRLQIAAPGQGAAVDASLPAPYTFRYIEKAGERIGVLMRFEDGGGWSRTRFALWQTAVDDSLLPATPSGRWSLQSDGPDPLELWLFRDDRDPMADRSRPRRPSRFWSAGYVLRDALGAPPLEDDPGTAVLRSGTLSVLATAAGPAIEAVQANVRQGNGNAAQAAYSGRREDGLRLTVSELVDDGWTDRGTPAAANGSQRRVRMSGTSAAAGLRARALLGLGPA